MDKAKILIVEDCKVTREALCELLRRDYDVENVGDAESALTKLAQMTFDLIIVDIGLPVMDGYKFCASLRAQDATANMPIIIFSGRGDIEDKLIGFSLGACDYVSKPVDLRELKARIQIQLKKTTAGWPEHQHFEVGPFQLSPVHQSVSVWANDQRLELQPSPLEYRLLYFFLTHIDHVLSREQLLNQVWGNSRFVSDRSVDAIISKLRQKLGPHAELLQSVRGQGYRFCKPEPHLKRVC